MLNFQKDIIFGIVIIIKYVFYSNLSYAHGWEVLKSKWKKHWPIFYMLKIALIISFRETSFGFKLFGIESAVANFSTWDQSYKLMEEGYLGLIVNKWKYVQRQE